MKHSSPTSSHAGQSGGAARGSAPNTGPASPASPPEQPQLDQFIADIEPFFYRRAVNYVDVGAYHGAVFARFLKSRLEIREAHLIEPNPESFKHLKEKATAAFSKQSLNLYPIALGATQTTVRMKSAKTMTRVIEEETEQHTVAKDDSETFTVACTTLDSMADMFTNGHVSILKIDVEGFEAQVLAGAAKLLEAQKVDVLYVEAGVDEESTQQCYFRVIDDMLRAHGYRLFRIYEQTNEWLEDSPLLRRMNLAYFSPKFAQANPYRLRKELMDQNDEAERLRGELAQRDEDVARLTEDVTRTGDELADQAAESSRLVGELRDQVRAAETTSSGLYEKLAALEASLARSEQERHRAAKRADEAAASLIETERRAGDAKLARAEAEAAAREVAEKLERAEARREALEARLEASAAALADVTATRLAARAERDTTRAERDAARAKRDAILAEVAALRASTSWRLTGPLRALKTSALQLNVGALGRRLRLLAAALRAPGLDPLTALRRRRRADATTKDIAASPLFDAAWYLKTYPDVASAGVDPARHYVLSGAAEGRDPGPKFSTSRYIMTYPDVAKSGINPLQHFVVYGEKEGRKSNGQGRMKAIAPLTEKPRQKVLAPSAARSEAGQRLKSEVADLTRKLWGGFSSFAVSGLNEICTSASNDPDQRANAAWELARWHVSSGEPTRSLQALAIVGECSKPLARNKKTKLLLFESLLSAGETEKAFARISESLRYRPGDADYLLSLANYWLKAAALGRVDRSDADQHRFAAINKVFIEAGLGPISLAVGSASLTIDAIRRETPRREVGGPKISVLMAAYGAEEHLHLAVESILTQTWRNLELIIVEDCSPDGTWEVMRRYADLDPRVRIERNRRNLGAYITRNRALGLATGEFVTVHDSDDWSHPEMLERQMEPLLQDGGPHGTFSMMARVTEDMVFGIRPSRRMLEIVHRSYPSLLMRRTDLDLLGAWDGVRANADAEMVTRARRRFGAKALQDVLPATPMSFFLTRPESLTQQTHSSLLSLTFGVRHEYDRQADYVRTQAPEDFVPSARLSKKSPFAAPEMLLPAHLRTSREYDLIIISDLSLKGGTRTCNTSYIDLATSEGQRVGLFHWPRADLRLLPDIDPDYRKRNQLDNVDILTWEEEARCRRVVVHHPPIMAHALDRFPRIEAREGVILVNQLPFQLLDRARRLYDVAQIDEEFGRLFGFLPVWAPISPLVRRHLGEFLDSSRMTDQDWSPPLTIGVTPPPHRPDTSRQPVIGRHSRDHWTKWPETPQALRGAYLAGDQPRVRILGGARTPKQIFGEMPKNWDVHDFDSIDVADFIDSLDFFVHFTHSQYIEEFGRNVGEAIARGVPAILPPQFEETFGNAAVYCEAADVSAIVERLWRDPEAYTAVARRGQDFALNRCGESSVRRRMLEPVKARLNGAAQGA